MSEELKDVELINREINVKKDAFRQYQRDLPFGEKMRIAFSLAERDKAIRNAVPCPKTITERRAGSDFQPFLIFSKRLFPRHF